ncbi:MAG: TIM-barrel domain-containing protein [Acidobacteriota bacterium]
MKFEAREATRRTKKWRTLAVGCLLLFTSVCTRMSSAEPHDGFTLLSVHKSSTGVYIRFTKGMLRVQPCMPNVVRITYSPTATIPDLSNPYMLSASCGPVAFHLQEGSQAVLITMPTLTVAISRRSGAVSFSQPDGTELLSESDFPMPRQVKPVVMNGLATDRASVWFALTPEERLYGLGQHQNGLLNQRNLEMELSQDNTNISIPMFLSSKGYGIFWNNASVTRWNNRFQPVLRMSSSVAKAVDYFFLNGPSFDTIVAEYRRLTGNVPLFPLWAYGYWQSKDAYSSQSELLGIAAKYRRLHIPLDNIVLDFGWETVLGSRVFTDKFPDPSLMVQSLHDEHVHLMVSLWPIFRPGSANYDQMLKDGLFIGGGVNRIPPWEPGTRLYDAFSAKGRDAYWRQVKHSLFDIGVDAFWLDSTEPSDIFGEEQGSMLAGAHTAMGNGSRYANLFPFMTTSAIYHGQRSVTDRKRVFMLSRSAFAGMQHEAAAAWSGDVATNFQTLKREIPAGLNYSLTGLPYWTTDIGGFNGGNTSDPAYQEVFVRWFQFGTFCPIFRVHGNRVNNQNELWSYGEQAQKILTLYDRLRYRLLPYIYTLAAMTTYESYTPMRALPFDFRADPKILDISDEFMFGPSLLVAPVTDPGVSFRHVYLPQGADWYDFWTGERVRGGQDEERATPLDTLPLYVRAGSIVPMGPESEFSDQHPNGPIEVRIYPGSDGKYRLYEDDGTSYDYEKGLYAWIGMQWNDKTRVFTLDARRGSYPGMKTHLEFVVVLVEPGQGTGEAVSGGGRTVEYDGAARTVRF